MLSLVRKTSAGIRGLVRKALYHLFLSRASQEFRDNHPLLLEILGHPTYRSFKGVCDEFGESFKEYAFAENMTHRVTELKNGLDADSATTAVFASG